MSKTIVMSLGGSLIAPEKIDIVFLKKFRRLILDFTKKGNKTVIICGGGNTAREYQKAAKQVFPKVGHRSLDWVGIGATRLNAELVSAMFGVDAYESIMGDPTKKIITKKRIIVGAGYIPGHSSDVDAVLAAKTFGAKTVFNLSNITYVYNKDPKKHKDAMPQKQMNWDDFRRMVGDQWVPGAHVPFDPVASRLAQQNKLAVVVLKGSDLNNLNKALMDKKFQGTLIS